MDIFGILENPENIKMNELGRINFVAQYFPFCSNKKDKVSQQQLIVLDNYLSSSDKLIRESLLYIHIPYCLTICSFCSCDRIHLPPGKMEDTLDRYLSKIFMEIEYYSHKKFIQDLTINHIHIGGGSPSLLSESQIKMLFAKIKKAFRVSSNVMLNFEGEARTLINESKLKTLKDLGIPRVSFGVQSFDKEVRNLCNLRPTMKQITNLVEMLKKLEMNVNIDLMYGLPGQDISVLKNDLKLAKEMGVDSLDFYRNVTYSSLPIHRDLRHSHPEIFDEKRKFDMYSEAVDRLEEFGYSAVTDEVFCRDSTKYCSIKQLPCKSGDERANIIGIGFGSFSWIGKYNLRNMHDPRYSHNVSNGFGPYLRAHEMSLDDEYTYMGIKGLGCGLIVSKADSYFPGFYKKYSVLINFLIEKGYVVDNGKSLEMTKKGLKHHYLIQLSFLNDEELNRSQRFTLDNVWRESQLEEIIS